MTRLVNEVRVLARYPCITLHVQFVLFLVEEKVLHRLEEAFRRNATASGYLPQATFIRDVIGEAAPPKLSEVSVVQHWTCLICVWVGGARWVWCRKGARWAWCKKGVWVLGGRGARWVCGILQCCDSLHRLIAV